MAKSTQPPQAERKPTNDYLEGGNRGDLRKFIDRTAVKQPEGDGGRVPPKRND